MTMGGAQAAGLTRHDWEAGFLLARARAAAD